MSDNKLILSKINNCFTVTGHFSSFNTFIQRTFSMQDFCIQYIFSVVSE